MSNLNKKLLESLDRLDSYILNEARDDKLHVTVISGDENEDFIKANKRKIVDVYTDGPLGYFFTKGTPSGRYAYDDNDGFFTSGEEMDPVSDPSQLYLPDGSINKDYIVSELGLTKWDGMFYDADGRTRYFSWGEMSDEEKEARAKKKEANAKEKAEKELNRKLFLDVAERIKNYAEKEMGIEIEYSVTAGYPVYFKKGSRTRLFRTWFYSDQRFPHYKIDKLENSYDKIVDEMYNKTIKMFCDKSYEFNHARSVAEKMRGREEKIRTYEPTSVQDFMKVIPKTFTFEGDTYKIKTSLRNTRYEVGDQYYIDVEVEGLNNKKVLKSVADGDDYYRGVVTEYLVEYAPYSKGFYMRGLRRDRYSGVYEFYVYMKDAFEEAGFKERSWNTIKSGETRVVNYMKKTGQLK